MSVNEWPQGAADPHQLAAAPKIPRPSGFHLPGGSAFPQWSRQKMMARLQDLAVERALLLERLAECDHHEQSVARLHAVHKDADAEYQAYLYGDRSHVQRPACYHH